MFLESSSIMKARREVYCCFEPGERLKQPKMKDTTCWVHHCLFLRPPWLAGFIEKFLAFKTLKWRSNLFALKAAIDGRVEPQSSSLFFVGFIVVVEEIYTSVAFDFADM